MGNWDPWGHSPGHKQIFPSAFPAPNPLQEADDAVFIIIFYYFGRLVYHSGPFLFGFPRFGGQADGLHADELRKGYGKGAGGQLGPDKGEGRSWGLL